MDVPENILVIIYKVLDNIINALMLIQRKTFVVTRNPILIFMSILNSGTEQLFNKVINKVPTTDHVWELLINADIPLFLPLPGSLTLYLHYIINDR